MKIFAEMLSGEMLQHAVVALVAFAAGLTIVRRLYGSLGFGASRSSCASCALGTCNAQAQTTSGTTAAQAVTILTRRPAEVTRATTPSQLRVR